MFRPAVPARTALPGWSRWARVAVHTLRDVPSPPFPTAVQCADGFGELLVPHRWVEALEAVWRVLPERSERPEVIRVVARLRRGPEALVLLAKCGALEWHILALSPPDDWRARLGLE